MTNPERPRGTITLPSQCPTCGHPAPWIHLLAPQEQVFMGKTLAITAPLHQCRSCGFSLLTTEDANALLRATLGVSPLNVNHTAGLRPESP